MAKISYQFDYDKKPGRSDNGRLRRLIIFCALTVLVVAGFFFFRPRPTSTSETENPSASDKTSTAMPSSVTQQTPSMPVTQSVPVEAADLIQKLEKQTMAAQQSRDYVEVRKKCLQILSTGKVPAGSETWDRVVKMLGEANIKILMSDLPFPEKKEVYTVKRNDALQRIARDFNTTVGVIQASNGMSPDNYIIRIGQTLRIYRGDWRIVVSKSDRRLCLYDGNELFKCYFIGIGRQNRTPVGSFSITSKIKNPDWYSPEGVIPFGSKDNVLGTRWLRLQPTGDTDKALTGYGIHGTWKADSIGKELSNGCVRMFNAEVEELFSIVPYRTPVVIKE